MPPNQPSVRSLSIAKPLYKAPDSNAFCRAQWMDALPSIAGLILAAGESSRMGRDKALLPYRDRTFLETIIRALRQAGLERIIVVLGHHATEIQRSVDLSALEVVVNPDYPRGQTSSLQAGLKALNPHDTEAVILGLVDHPAVSAEVVRSLVKAFRDSGSPVVVPTFQNRRGHPVLIGRELFPELLALDSDHGANTVVRKYRDRELCLEVSEEGILLDIDNAEDYRNLRVRLA